VLDFLVDLDPAGGRQAALEEGVRRAIVAGRLTAGTRLPSTRALAKELHCARATVVAAYEQLVAEGFLTAERGAGTRVAAVQPLVTPPATDLRPPSTFAADFRPGEPDNSSFPRAQWLASTRRALARAPDDLFGYGDPRGTHELRVALASYLGRARAVAADPSRIVVFGGFAHALSVLADALRHLGLGEVAVEDPALPFHPSFLRRAGLSVATVPVDDQGLRVVDLRSTAARAVLTTPAHQYPLGIALAPARRTALVEWARQSDGWVIEDDYDGEFRYDRQPVGAVQSLDPERVIYGGTASKSLGAGLHIAWLVVPDVLLEPLVETARWRVGVSAVEQATLADFIASGRLDRHVRQMRLAYRRRRDTLAATLQRAAPWMTFCGISAGLHGTVPLVETGREREILTNAARRSIGMHPLSAHYSDGRAEGLVLGYSRPSGHAFSGALGRLDRFLSDVSVQSS
jgi:GntR family transcriptional regulator/MocR family aminotransferase